MFTFDEYAENYESARFSTIHELFVKHFVEAKYNVEWKGKWREQRVKRCTRILAYDREKNKHANEKSEDVDKTGWTCVDCRRVGTRSKPVFVCDAAGLVVLCDACVVYHWKPLLNVVQFMASKGHAGDLTQVELRTNTLKMKMYRRLKKIARREDEEDLRAKFEQLNLSVTQGHVALMAWQCLEDISPVLRMVTFQWRGLM